MSKATPQYVEHLPQIYQDILDGFWMFNPNLRTDRGVAADSIYAIYRDRYTLGEVQEACEQMVDGGALRVEKEIFLYPTDLGRQLIEIRQTQAGRKPVPEFVPPQ